MSNPFVETIESEFRRRGIVAGLIYENFDERAFGNAEAIYVIGNLLLRFLRDRSDELISVGGSASRQRFHDFDDVAVWMGWCTPEELSTYDSTPDFSQPPPGPFFTLSKGIELIWLDMNRLQEAFSPELKQSTDRQLDEIRRGRSTS